MVEICCPPPKLVSVKVKRWTAPLFEFVLLEPSSLIAPTANLVPSPLSATAEPK